MTTTTTEKTTPTNNEIKEPDSCNFDVDMCGWESKDDRWFLTNGKDSDLYGLYGPGSDQTSLQSNVA